MAVGPIEGPRRILPSPNPDWDFNHLLEEFYAQINDNDVSRLLRLFKGTVPEHVNTLEAMFDALRRPPERLTSDNIVYLQKIAFFINNDDLYYKTIKYVEIRNPHSLHCVREGIRLGVGQEYVKFHVRNHYEYVTNGEVNSLRETVANILMVDIEHITLSGVEATGSFLVTFILPIMFVKVLKRIFMSKTASKFTRALARRGVDTVYIYDETFPVEIKDQEDYQDNDQAKFISELQDQLSHTQSQNNYMNEEILRLKHRKDTKQKGKSGYVDEKAQVTSTINYGVNTTICQDNGPPKKPKCETRTRLGQPLSFILGHMPLAMVYAACIICIASAFSYYVK